MSDSVMKLNNLFQVKPRTVNQLAWIDRICGDVWTSTVLVDDKISFTGKGATKKIARDAAARKAYDFFRAH
ncbi:hypothetical protein AURDEDRAFT_175810 [Auricularia subglabra TFB-10046 SS5]|uniref:DRBM domain-containing protein n=1 Tax=Auricularia subglabra (strain TFB-10046 / SS5) TaxID=717982 RepID=J0WSI3_AURST|nr:hypothetical protein AURDEDRAFT_175810 [Auricularia subglabra TFB-10046 SS5]